MLKAIRPILIFIIFLLGNFPFISTATLSFEDAAYPELASSGRALAMGNAFISKVDDSMAVVYNPAGLGTVRRAKLHLTNMHLEFNKEWINVGTSGSAISNISNIFSLDGIRKILLENKGKLIHSRFSFLPNFTMRHFSLGYLLSKQNKATIGTESGAKFELADRLDYGPYVSLNIPFIGGIFKVGLTGILLNRKEKIADVDANTTIDFKSSDYNQGSALILDGGAKLTLPFIMLPTISAVVHNSLDTKFEADSGTSPTKIERTVSLGFSLTPNIGKRTRMHIEINYKDLTSQYSGVADKRKINFGMEFSFYRIVFLRLGYGDGYGSFGFGIKTKNLEFDLTSYAVDTTSNEFRGAEDRRFSLSISSGF